MAIAIAAAHHRRQQAIVARIARAAAALWRQLDRQFLDHSWHASVGPRMFAAVAAGQLLAAAPSDMYTDAVLAAQGLDTAASGMLVARSLSGIASDGRDLASLLYQPVIATKYAIGQGATVDRALAVGLANLDMIVRTQVADAGRVGVGIATTARPDVSGYVRMLNPPSCSRCAVLAGKWYAWNAGFQRHPRCDCIAIPAAEKTAGDLTTDPQAYFDSLDESGQNRIFTKAGAEAIRDGADIGQVVNARRGMYTAGGRVYTSEGDSVRGFHGGYIHDADGTTRRRGSGQLVKRGGRYRQTTAARLMPEQIYRDAANRNDAIRLLRLNGFLSPDTSRHRPLADDFTAAAHDTDALNAVPAGLGRRTPGMVATTRDQQHAMHEYTSSYFYAINGQLRRDEVGDTAETIRRLDAAMDLSPLQKDVGVWRGIADASRLFGGRLAGDLTGMEWTEKAYTSTSAVERISHGFTYRSGQVLMRILAPRGVKALKLSPINEQAEILLQRGLKFRVIADRGTSPEGYRLIDVEVIR